MSTPCYRWESTKYVFMWCLFQLCSVNWIHLPETIELYGPFTRANDTKIISVPVEIMIRYLIKMKMDDLQWHSIWLDKRYILVLRTRMLSHVLRKKPVQWTRVDEIHSIACESRKIRFCRACTSRIWHICEQRGLLNLCKILWSQTVFLTLNRMQRTLSFTLSIF